jgi:hypothetical protein
MQRSAMKPGKIYSYETRICALCRCDIDRWSSADLDLLFNSLKEHGPESVVTLHNQLQGGWQTEEDVQACYLAVLLKRIRPMLNRRRYRWAMCFQLDACACAQRP